MLLELVFQRRIVLFGCHLRQRAFQHGQSTLASGEQLHAPVESGTVPTLVSQFSFLKLGWGRGWVEWGEEEEKLTGA